MIIPHENLKDLSEIPDKVKEGLKIVAIETVEEGIAYVFGIDRSKRR